jgi:hypothetical protein
MYTVYATSIAFLFDFKTRKPRVGVTEKEIRQEVGLWVMNHSPTCCAK